MLYMITSSWGFFAHKEINKLAIFTLPPQLAFFYKKHMDYIVEHAVDADKRRYVSKNEAPRHYLDTDHYGSHPFDSIPPKWEDAVAKYSEDTLMAHGIVPWQIEKSFYLLVNAFSKRNLKQILRYSADLGHYIADAHVPLHTTHNYNGQFSHQEGIHAFWESRLPELYAKQYNFFVGPAQYVEKPLQKSWEIVRNSFSLVDTLLLEEKRLTQYIPPDQKYAFEQRNNEITKVYAQDFAALYHEQLKGMVEQQMRSAVEEVGSFWYSAWITAGQPDLSQLKEQATEVKSDSSGVFFKK